MPNKLTNVTDNNVGKITDTEIKKALDICSKSNNGCSYSKYPCKDCYLNGQPMCSSVLIQDTIDLINRKDQENESLKAEVERLREIRDLCNTTILEKNEQIEKLEISDASKEECTIRQHGEIKELKAEVERLQEEIRIISLNRNMALLEKETLYDVQKTVKAEIINILAERQVAKQEVDRLSVLVIELQNQLKTAKAEAYKECIEKVKGKARLVCTGHGEAGFVVDILDIDNLLNELVGDNNGKDL